MTFDAEMVICNDSGSMETLASLVAPLSVATCWMVLVTLPLVTSLWI